MGKRIAVIAVCSIAGSFTSIIVATAIVYVATSWPLGRILQLAGGFDFFLVPAVIAFSGFFGAVASFLLALVYGQPTEQAVWVIALAMPGALILASLLSGAISDAALTLILGTGVVSGMYVSKALCRLLGYPMTRRPPTPPARGTDL